MRPLLFFLGTVSGALDTTAAFIAGLAGGCAVAATLDHAEFA